MVKLYSMMNKIMPNCLKYCILAKSTVDFWYKHDMIIMDGCVQCMADIGNIFGGVFK